MTEEQRIEAAKLKRMLGGLLEHEGWQWLAEAAKVQISHRENEVLLKPTENVSAQEYMKGELQGIKLFLSLPRNGLEMSEAVLKAAMEDEEGDE